MTRAPQVYAGMVALGLGVLGSMLYGGIVGFFLGLAGGAFGVATLVMMIRLLEQSAAQRRTGAFGVALTLAMAAGKVPVLLFLAKASRAISDASFDCFLGGVMLVYFGLVGWAAVQPTAPAKTPDGPPTD